VLVKLFANILSNFQVRAYWWQYLGEFEQEFTHILLSIWS